MKNFIKNVKCWFEDIIKPLVVVTYILLCLLVFQISFIYTTYLYYDIVG